MNPTSGGVDSPTIGPDLYNAAVQVLSSNGTIIASGSANNLKTVLTNIPVPSDDTYTIKVTASPTAPASVGNYTITAWDSTPIVLPGTVNEQQSGSLLTPYSVNQWTFAGSAGQQVRFHLIGLSSQNITFALTGPNGYTAFTGATGDSPLINLPSTGNYSIIVSSPTGDIGTYAFSFNLTTQTALTLDQPYSGTLVVGAEAQLFSVVVTPPEALVINLTDTNIDHNELYVGFGQMPTPLNYAYAATGAGANQQILVPNAYAGTWYIFMDSEAVAVPPSGFTLTASGDETLITGSKPSEGAVNSVTTLTLTGVGFNSGSVVTLVPPTGPAYPVTSATADLSTQMTVTIAAGSIPAGTYGIRVTQPDTVSSYLPNALTMLATGQAILTTHVELPNPIGYHIASTLYVDYSNTGTVAMQAPLLVLSATMDGIEGALMTLDPTLQTSGFWTSATPAGYSQSVDILASGATPGILQPGESERVPVYYAGWLNYLWDFSRPPVYFSLDVDKMDDTTPINWAANKAKLKPAGLSDTAWNQIFSNLLTQTGATLGSYVQMLDDNAEYLGKLGNNVTDVAKLWQFATEQAEGIRPEPTLATVTDDSLPTPGSLSLDFTRTFNNTIPGRSQMGSLGLGGTTPWQQSLQIESDGTVIYYDGDGMDYTYQPDRRYVGKYFSETGDTSTLSSDGNGGYLRTDPDGTAMDFTSSGPLAYTQDIDGNRITAGYSNGRLTSLTASSGQSLSFTYNAAGLVASLVDSAGRTTTYQYDTSNQHLISVTGYNDQTTSYTYDTATGSPSVDALTTVANPGGTHQYYTYDSNGRLAASYLDGGAEKTNYSYLLGQITEIDALGEATTQFYDQNEFLAKTIDAMGNGTYYTYDANYNLTKVTNAENQSTAYTYDSRGNVTSMTDYLGYTTKFTYITSLNELASMTDANGNTTQYTYNGSGDLLETLFADGTYSTSTFNPLGEATSFINQNGQPINYAYNAADQVTQERFSDGTQYFYTYDANGNLLTATDLDGTTVFTYDAFSELLTEVAYPNNMYLKFTYNSAGQRMQVVDQTGFTTNYIYNSLGQLAGLTDGGGNPIVTYTFDAAGRVSEKLNANGTFTTYAYDADGNVLHLINYSPANQINSRFDYTYDALGQVATEAINDGNWTYAYDGDGQLTHAVFLSTNHAIPSQDMVYNYDALGNRTSTVINGTTTKYVVNDMNEYTSVGGVPYTYDADGNLVSDGTNNYTYNSLNQLVSTASAAGTIAYTYNALGARVSTNVAGVTTQYLIDPTGLTNVVGTFNAINVAISSYTYAIGLVDQISRSTSTAYFYDFDAAGNTIGLTSTSGSYVNSYDYMPFGTKLSASTSVLNPFEFSGQVGLLIDSTGMIWARTRGFSLTLGRFLSTDPTGASWRPAEFLHLC